MTLMSALRSWTSGALRFLVSSDGHGRGDVSFTLKLETVTCASLCGDVMSPREPG
jgi:hypothetical protein